MTPTETAALLRQLNEWRRGGDIDPPGTLAVGEAIDAAVEMIERLAARLEAAEKERDELRAELKEVRYRAVVAHDTINTLRAKIKAMEKQEPVAWCATDETGTVVEALGMNQSRRFDTPLGVLPRAKGEEK